MFILSAFGLIAIASAYWAVVRGPNILARDDNPRLVEAELRIRRGDILDVNNSPLAVTIGQGAELQRTYPVPSAAPAVGYYSFRYGTSGIEEAYDGLLRGESGDFWSDFWHIDTLAEPQTGHDIRLTLDSRWQAEANALLGDNSGAVILFSLPDVAVRAMASTPGYDPNQLDDDFDLLAADQQAPLLNRATQGQYQPGLLLQPFLLAAAQQSGLIDLRQPIDEVTTGVVVNGRTVACQGEIGETMTWGQVLRARCPGPMSTLAELLRNDGLMSAMEVFGLTSQPELAIVPEGDTTPTIIELGLAAIGQDAIAVSPLQIALALASLANDGQYKPAQLVLAVQDLNDEWVPVRPADEVRQVVSASASRQILQQFSDHEGIKEHDVAVLSGPEGEMNSWYLGLAPADSPRYGVVVIVEKDESMTAAQSIGRTLLKGVLDPDNK